jgi:DNA-binding HxlR family transcriptional regulator
LRALARVGDRRTPLVVEALPGGPQRFNDLPGQIPGIAANILSERLKRLELGPRASPALMIEARSASVST